MIAEAIKKLIELGEESPQNRIINAGDPSTHVRYVDQAGKIVVEPKPLGPRKIKVNDLASLVDLAVSPIPGYEKSSRSIYVGTEAIVLVFNDDHGLEQARLPLLISPEGRFAGNACDTGTIELDIDKMRDLFRVTLRGALNPNDREKFVASISKLETFRKLDAEAQKDRASQGFRQSTNEAVAPGYTTPPENQTLNLRFYSNSFANIRKPADFIVDPDPATGKWLIKAIKTSIQDALEQTTAALAGEVSKLLQGKTLADGGSVRVVIGEFTR